MGPERSVLGLQDPATYPFPKLNSTFNTAENILPCVHSDN